MKCSEIITNISEPIWAAGELFISDVKQNGDVWNWSRSEVTEHRGGFGYFKNWPEVLRIETCHCGWIRLEFTWSDNSDLLSFPSDCQSHYPWQPWETSQRVKNDANALYRKGLKLCILRDPNLNYLSMYFPEMSRMTKTSTIRLWAVRLHTERREKRPPPPPSMMETIGILILTSR